jgi:hypothetical protein
MEFRKKKSIYRWIRALHRDIGFFVIGLTVIYCISGIMLTYRDTAFLRSETSIEKTIDSRLRANQLGKALQLREIQVLSEDEKEIRFSRGTYNKETGVASYLSKEIPWVLQSFNNLHKVPSKESRHWFTSLYAILLLFLALSSFWMYKPGNKYFKRGLTTASLGVFFSLALIFI